MNKITQKTKSLVRASLFCALCTVATLIAFPAGIGYVNAGDIIVLLAAFSLSLPEAVAAAAIGSATADLICGYAIYAPATFIIKGVMVICAVALKKGLNKISVPSPIAIFLSCVCAELCMALGYLIYEWTVLGYGIAALSSTIPNLIQGGFGCVGGILLYYILKNTRLTDKLTAI